MVAANPLISRSHVPAAAGGNIRMIKRPLSRVTVPTLCILLSMFALAVREETESSEMATKSISVPGRSANRGQRRTWMGTCPPDVTARSGGNHARGDSSGGPAAGAPVHEWGTYPDMLAWNVIF